MFPFVERKSIMTKFNRSFKVPAVEAAFSVAMLGAHAVMEKYWNFDKHNKLTNFIITGALSKDEMRIRRSIAAVMCAIGIITDLVSAIVYKIRDRKTDKRFDEISTHSVNDSEVPDFVKEAYKAS